MRLDSSVACSSALPPCPDLRVGTQLDVLKIQEQGSWKPNTFQSKYAHTCPRGKQSQRGSHSTSELGIVP